MRMDLSFREETWPQASRTKVFAGILWFAFPLMALVAASIIYFFFFSNKKTGYR